MAMVWCTLPNGTKKKLPSTCYYASDKYKSRRSEAIRNQRNEYAKFKSGRSNSCRNVNWGNTFRDVNWR